MSQSRPVTHLIAESLPFSMPNSKSVIRLRFFLPYFFSTFLALFSAPFHISGLHDLLRSVVVGSGMHRLFIEFTKTALKTSIKESEMIVLNDNDLEIGIYPGRCIETKNFKKQSKRSIKWSEVKRSNVLRNVRPRLSTKPILWRNVRRNLLNWTQSLSS